MKGTIYSLPAQGQPGYIKRQGMLTLYKFTQEDLEAMPGGADLKPKAPVEFDIVELNNNKFAVNLRHTTLDIQQPDPDPPDYQDNAPPGPTPAPYTFVPVLTGGDDEDRIPLFPAAFHGGSTEQAADVQRLSGSLRFELRALTPLLVGQYRYPVTKLLSDPAPYDHDKQVLEPLLIDHGSVNTAVMRPPKPDDKAGWNKCRVVLPSTSLKGPVRQNIGAILNAPMERVTERWYSYRPNLDVTASPDGQRYHCYAAVILDDEATKVKLVNKMTNVIFVENPRAADIDPQQWPDETKFNFITKTLVPGDYWTKNLFGYEQNHNRLLYVGTAPLQPLQGRYRVYEYRTGIDGDCILAAAIKANATNPNEFRFRHHFRALVKESDLTLELPLDLLVKQRFEATREALTNETYGHLGHFPGKEKLKGELKKAKEAMLGKQLARHQLIFVEVRLEEGQPTEIVSFGTHFRYRWRYADSVREILVDAQAGITRTRPELQAPEAERLGVDGTPNQLSGARLLFGFATANARQREKSLGNDKIGVEGFSRLAGRVAFNHAVEVIGYAKNSAMPTERFLYRNNGDKPEDFALPLRILGEPRPSAVEHYLQQNEIETGPGATKTYGDLPGFETSGVALNGRKFYRHQPIKVAAGAVTANAPFLARNGDEIATNQATLARVVSRPGTVFHFTVRYRDLHCWELGALLLALCPDLITRVDQERLDGRLTSLIDSAKKDAPGDQATCFAIKLGYARPLGFGSAVVHLTRADSLVRQNDLPAMVPEPERDNWQRDAINAYLSLRNDQGAHLIPWLQAVRYAGCQPAAYPTRRKTPAAEPTIYDHHTEIRRQHSKLRRQQASGGPRKDKPVWPITDPGEPWQSKNTTTDTP